MSNRAPITIQEALRQSLKSRPRQSSDLVEAIERAEQLAHRLGLHVTAGALNRAKNAYGWEAAGDPEQAHRAAFDKRPVR